MRYYFVYKTTNKINKKFYIGVHATDNLDDNYLGSGKYLADAIQHYGKDCFEREILSFHSSYEEALQKESELVTIELVESNDCYNLTLGGGKPPLMQGETHPLFGKSRPDSSKRMTENNPSKGKFAKNSHSFGTLVVYDTTTKKNIRVKKDDTRIITGEVIPINKGKVTVRDKEGSVFQVAKDDPRYVSGELIHISKGKTRTFSDEEKEQKYKTRRGQKRSVETKKKMSGRTAWNKGKTGYKTNAGQKISKMLKGNPKPLVKCPHCNKEGGVSVMKRFHFERCKSICV